jgi:DNA topoisomerase I
VIVESPSKCETISKILNSPEASQNDNSTGVQYKVLACKGHIRNLSSKKPETPKPPEFPYTIPGVDLAKNYAPIYALLPDKLGVVRELRQASKAASEILLATDADREGEAMAWHLTQVLGDKHRYKRVSFVEITKQAVLEAIRNPFELNPHLIEAQETRRVLDRLAGYTVSPLLWKKISPGLSAGRVQSVGMALLVQRERERLLFPVTEYWRILAQFDNGPPSSLNHALFTLLSLNETEFVASKSIDFTVESINDSTSVAHTDLFHLNTEEKARQLVTLFEDATTQWTVKNVTFRRRTQSAPPPFITSSLQQDAARKLGWKVSRTMQVAQQLYEKGLITYMRTDSTALSQDAEAVLKRTLRDKYYNSSDASSKAYKKRRRKASKFAQEAHEAIRPAIVDGNFPSPATVEIDESGKALYRMIYQRTAASFMAPRVTNTTRVVVQGMNRHGSAEFFATGTVVLELGYSEAYHVDGEAASSRKANAEIDDGSTDNLVLPILREGQVVQLASLRPTQHETQPPARYTEASLVKQLEVLGVGRPSTYAKVLQVLEDRAYVLEMGRSRRNSFVKSSESTPAKRASGQIGVTPRSTQDASLVPTLSAFAVTAMLEKHCSTIVDPEFTAEMELRLDAIARGGGDSSAESNASAGATESRSQYLDAFYAGPSGLAAVVKDVEKQSLGDEARRVTLPALSPLSVSGSVGLFVGPWGPYIQSLSEAKASQSTTAALPVDLASDLSRISPDSLQAVLSLKVGGGELLGKHPNDGRRILLKTGRYGAYLQWGDDGEETSTSHSLPRDMASISSERLSFEDAVSYVSLPRTVCSLDNLPVVASLGPYGPYLKYNNSYVSLGKADADVLSISPATAVRLIEDSRGKGISGISLGVVAELGSMDGGLVRVKSGRYGHYINWKKVNAKLPAHYAANPRDLPLDEAWGIIQQRLQGSGASQGSKSSKSRSKAASMDRTRPKRPKSSYLFFCQEMRPQLSTKGRSLAETSKELARLWAETENRKPYDDLAEVDRSRYEQEKSATGSVK